MTIDTEELRRKLYSDDLIDHIDIHANVKPVLTELLDRLEAAERNLNCCQGEREEAAALFLSVKTRLTEDCDALRAKVEVMENQEPIVEVRGAADIPNGFLVFTLVNGYMPKLGDKFYALPGGQPTPSIPEGIQRVARDFYWDSAALHHVPFVRVEFQPVAANSPDDAKGWQDRDRFFAAMLDAASEAKS